MDMEEFMVLISTTLSCVCVGFQLHHVKKHPNVLPFMSLTMMSILTFGHMIPLFLNFEALSSHQSSNNNNKNNYAFGPIGWLKFNEIGIRLVTMVAFWLNFGLLQLTWSSRNTSENCNSKSLWDAELKVALFTLYLYVSGLLLLFPLLFMLKMDGENVSVFHHLKSYGGSVLDVFLLPQIILNEFSDMTTQNVLSSSFYFGTTFVRLLTHSYDLYRTLNYYAFLKADFMCIIWNFVIPLVGIMFAIIVSIQQHYGPHYILPQRLKGSNNVYERVTEVIFESEEEAEKITKMENEVFDDAKCKLHDDLGESKLRNS